MSPDEFRKAESLFLAACALPAAERIAFVERATLDDRTLRSRVLRLLRHDDRPVLALEPAIGDAVRSVGEELLRRSAAPTPTRIGAYRIVRPLGEGGFGVVYLAEQENPRRTVALKVVRWHLASGEALGRFEHEAHILGQLQHPGIAQIFEAGVAEVAFEPGEGPPYPSRMPYYAMEYVHGPNLLDYANAPGQDRPALGVAERLELIARICDALQHAHQNGIIHRDLKPDNILVVDPGGGSADGPSPHEFALGAQPKLLDFGVARPLEWDPDATHRTHAGQIVGTPAYMSPEQVRGVPYRVDTRSDVYAVGLLLYQLLAGRLPYEFPSGNMAEILRIIEEQPPAPLRTRGSTRGGRLDADVEAIVSKALAKDCDRRYQSAAALASDIRRYLAGDPIEAKRDSALYLLRKNVQRYRSVVSAAAAFVVLLAGFATWAVSQARLNRRLADESIHARNEALRERDRANQTAQRLALEIAQGNVARGRALALAGNFPDAESVLWREFLAAPAAPAPLWALRELYSRYANLATMRSEAAVVRAFALHPDGRELASAGDSVNIEIWDLATRRRLRMLVGHENVVRNLAVSPDGVWLASGDTGGKLVLWDWATGTRVHALDAHAPGVVSVCFSPDGQRMVSGGADKRLRIWETATGRCVATYAAHTATVARIDIDAAGQMLASAGTDGELTTWAAEPLLRGEGAAADAPLDPVAPPAAARARTRKAHQDSVIDLAISPDGRRLATSGWTHDRSVRLWDLDADVPVATLRLPAGIGNALAFSRDGAFLYVGTWFAIDIWSVADCELVGKICKGSCMALLASSRQPHVFSGSYNQIRVWDVGPAANAIASTGELGESVVFGPDGSLAISQADGSIQLRDLRSGEVLRNFAGGDSPRAPSGATFRVRALCASPDGSELACVSRTGELRRWNVHTGSCLATASDVNYITQQSVAYSPDGRRLAIARRSARFTIEPIDGRGRVFEIPASGGEALCACFSPDGKLLATSSREPAIRLWTSDGEPAARLACPHTPWGLAFSPDGAKVLTGTWAFTVEAWDVATGAHLHTFDGHAATVWGVAFKPDDPDVFASWSSDGTLRLWSLRSGENLATFELCPGEETLVASFSPDGRWIAVTCSGGEVRRIDLRQADRRLAGNLDAQLARLRGDPAAALDEPGARALMQSLASDALSSPGSGQSPAPP